MNSLIEKRLSELKKKSFNELSQLNDYQGENLKENGKEITLSVWKDMVGEHELRIVVQSYQHYRFLYWLLGFGRIDAEGFTIDNTGKLRTLPREELYKFI